MVLGPSDTVPFCNSTVGTGNNASDSDFNDFLLLPE